MGCAEYSAAGARGAPFCVAGHTPPVGVAVWRNVLSDSTFQESLTARKLYDVMTSLQQFAAACSNFLIR